MCSWWCLCCCCRDDSDRCSLQIHGVLKNLRSNVNSTVHSCQDFFSEIQVYFKFIWSDTELYWTIFPTNGIFCCRSDSSFPFFFYLHNTNQRCGNAAIPVLQTVNCNEDTSIAQQTLCIVLRAYLAWASISKVKG